MLSCWKVFYRVKENRRFTKLQKQHFCCPACLASATRRTLVYPTSCVRTRRSCLWTAAVWVPLIKEDATSAGCAVPSNMVPPYHIAWALSRRQPCPHQGGSTVYLSWSGKLQRKLWWSGGHHPAPGPKPVQAASLLLIYEPGRQCLLYLYQTMCSVEWKVWAQPPVQPWIKVHPYFLSLSCYHHILFLTSTWAGWWQDSKGNEICCAHLCNESAVPWKCHTKLHFSQAFYKRQIAEITLDAPVVWKEHGIN